MSQPPDTDLATAPYAPPVDCSATYDCQFPELPWLPWVGRHWRERAPHRRLLIVGESFYADETGFPGSFEARGNDRNYARRVVDECLIKDEWGARTLCNIPKLLFGTSAIDRKRFWRDTIYFNLVQRLMDSKTGRPGPNDFYSGWFTVLRMFEILRPSFCVVLGVGSANSFTRAVGQREWEVSPVSVGAKVSRTRSRRATLRRASESVQILFVQHPGHHFSWRKWHEHLNATESDLMSWLREENYTALPDERVST